MRLAWTSRAGSAQASGPGVRGQGRGQPTQASNGANEARPWRDDRPSSPAAGDQPEGWIGPAYVHVHGRSLVRRRRPVTFEPAHGAAA